MINGRTTELQSMSLSAATIVREWSEQWINGGRGCVSTDVVSVDIRHLPQRCAQPIVSPDQAVVDRELVVLIRRLPDIRTEF